MSIRNGMSTALRDIGTVVAAAWIGTLIAASAPVQAGQWTQLPVTDDFGDECMFAFTGVINPGDLTAIIDYPAWSENYRKRVCLDSPGGSLKEVYDFVTRSTEPGLDFATTIRSGARCESACSILFMFGQSWGANSPYPDRVMEPGARLGFHSPFLDMAVSEDQREDAFRVALDVAKLLMDKSYKATTQAGAPLPSELVSLVLSTPGDEMHYVETVGEMALLGIEQPIGGDARIRVAADRENVAALVERICVSSYAMTFRNWVVEDGYNFSDLVAFVDHTIGSTSDGDYFGDLAAGDALTLEKLVELPPSDYQQAKIVGIVSGGPLYVPGWYSAGAALYCRAELNVEPGSGYYDVQTDYYTVSFGALFDLDDDPLPEWNGDYDVIPAGMIPIDSRY